VIMIGNQRYEPSRSDYDPKLMPVVRVFSNGALYFDDETILLQTGKIIFADGSVSAPITIEDGVFISTDNGRMISFTDCTFIKAGSVDISHSRALTKSQVCLQLIVDGSSKNVSKNNVLQFKSAVTY
jgi:hypothetical protein